MWVRQEVRMTPPPNMVRQENRVTMVGVWKKRREGQYGEKKVFFPSDLLAFYLTQPTHPDTEQWKNAHLS